MRLNKAGVVLYSQYCKGCGICIELCPLRILKWSQLQNSDGYDVPFLPEPEKCTGCRVCEITCPEMAIDVIKEANFVK